MIFWEEAAADWFSKRGPDAADLRDPETAWGRCVLESDLLRDDLRRYSTTAETVLLLRVTGQTYSGREHWAVAVFDAAYPENTTVVDVTLRQFPALGADVAVPWVGNLLDWYDLVVDGMADHLTVAAHDDPQAPAVWTDAYARDDVEPGDVVVPWTVR